MNLLVTPMESIYFLIRIGNKKYFTVSDKFGIFVRPLYVKVGKFPPVDVFNENEDEI